MNILWGFENISLPWEYLQKDYKHFIRLQNCSWALGIFTTGQQIFHGASKLFPGLENIYKRTINIL
jgi:hypothetical protein